MKQEKMIDGVRHVLNPKTGEYLPDTEILKGWTYVLDRGKFPVLSDLSEGSPYRSDIGSGKERISGDGSGIGKTIGRRKKRFWDSQKRSST